MGRALATSWPRRDNRITIIGRAIAGARSWQKVRSGAPRKRRNRKPTKTSRSNPPPISRRRPNPLTARAAAVPWAAHSARRPEAGPPRPMPRVVGVDHLVLSVGDLARSKVFYRKLLGSLGFKLKYDYADSAGWSNGKTLFW